MREQILNTIKEGSSIYADLIAKYSQILPENIIAGSINTYETELPRHINNFLSILNMVEQKESYKPVKNIQEAIDIFVGKDVQNSIDIALANKTIVGVGGNAEKPLSAKELLESAKYGIDSGVQLLQMQRMAGKISNGEF